MAQTIRIRLRFSYSKNGVSYAKSFDSTTPVTGATDTWNSRSEVISCTTTGNGTAIPASGAADSGGLIAARNTDTTNYVGILDSAAVAQSAQMRAGDIALFRIVDGDSAVRFKSNTSACVVQYWCFPV